MSKDKESIQVTIRVRPLSDKYQSPYPDKLIKLPKPASGFRKIPIPSTLPPIRTKKKNIPSTPSVIKTHKMICSSKLEKKAPSTVWKVTPPLIPGYNCTIFAYGQTGAGKTFTMMGVNPEHENYYE